MLEVGHTELRDPFSFTFLPSRREAWFNLAMAAPDRIRDLDTRRAWARARAPLWFVLGTIMIALFNAALVLLALAAAARFWSWASGDGFRDSPLWDYLGPGAALMVAGADATPWTIR